MTTTITSLSATTHDRAARALAGEWGSSLAELPISFDDVAGVEAMSPHEQYATGVALIAEHAPIRILPHQPIVGAATLKASTWHRLPIEHHGQSFWSTSHLTPGFEKVVTLGYRGLQDRIEERLARGVDAEGEETLRAMLRCLDATRVWHARHLALLNRLIAESDGIERMDYAAIRDTLLCVPEYPATTFREAVQSLWSAFCFQRLCGNWPGIGRIDMILGPYLDRDLASGAITLDDAREWIAAFWINGCDWLGVGNDGRGEGEYFANIVLGGLDADGRQVDNTLTDMVLEVVSELHIAEMPISVRISERTTETRLRRIAELIRAGNGVIAVYNEDLVIHALVRFGYPEREARRFANDGCWEVQIPGETHFAYEPFDMLQLLQRVMGLADDGPLPDFPDFESFFAAFHTELAAHIAGFHQRADGFANKADPTPLIDLFVDDCIERARGYCHRGARYSVYAPHAGGVPDTANSLLAVKRLVYDEQRVSYPELAAALRENWESHEELRRHALTTTPRYGNDHPEADAMTRRVLEAFLREVESAPGRNGVLRPAGVSTFERAVVWREHRKATADGYRVGDILATNFSPTPGSDTLGPTAVLHSLGAMGLERVPNGCALELKLLPSGVAGEEGLAALVALLRGFLTLGGFFMQLDVVSSELLREAQRDPEKYPNLAVRISGWSARFNTLGEEFQELVIRRTEQKE